MKLIFRTLCCFLCAAMLCAAASHGTHGSAMVDGQPAKEEILRTTRTLTHGNRSHEEAVSPMPNPELWFETLLANKRKELQK